MLDIQIRDGHFKSKTAFTVQVQKPWTGTPAGSALRPACQLLKSKIRIPKSMKQIYQYAMLLLSGRIVYINLCSLSISLEWISRRITKSQCFLNKVLDHTSISAVCKVYTVA